MRRIHQQKLFISLIASLAFALIGAHQADVAVDYERRAEAAFAAGQYSEADFLYSRAEESSLEPGRTAFNHGVALFHLGRYRDAERLFQCSLEATSNGGDKAKIWFNLGTCLLYGSNGQDAIRLAEAMDCFHHCLTAAGDEGLRDDARHNLELSKQFWRRLRQNEPPPEENEPPGNDSRPPDREPNTPMNSSPEASNSNSSGGSQRPASPAPSEGPKPIPTNQQHPGAGHLPPIPESEQLKPLSPQEARELLQQAAERIARERKAMQKAGVGNEPRGYPDW
ncbi:MAG TPA: tetratricopeptide repeat protein [Gemmataceae bacterium]|jgi:tetratricopeptide (TPR) repeat protein|nr:tetratricopeptide repeat protein [Gemmataceae bacterium]